ncbi:YiiD C-terminal domain-containing protein [Acidovorax sp. A1169]|uniref:YiiD C-terminal domain-containing protein n=1 Tax=Acidovorax sp. A1169 TaxID=3059524 RepID=UPI002737BCEA|nr:YiiD C-terminal domain-containing protein [Acidovorax sp. A1169]MDP4074665.1 YiiD C-terminal domain-containing protein [Acidovorax sp. A1169]
MSPNDLQDYLHQHIPLSSAMAVSVMEASIERVVLSAPLAPNINHRETVFGGSASAVAILAGWSMLHMKLSAQNLGSRLVIQRNTMEYGLPIDGTFTAVAEAPSEQAWRAFVRMFERKGLGRIEQASVLMYQGQPAGRLTGEFVAFGPGYS